MEWVSQCVCCCCYRVIYEDDLYLKVNLIRQEQDVEL